LRRNRYRNRNRILVYAEMIGLFRVATSFNPSKVGNRSEFSVNVLAISIAIPISIWMIPRGLPLGGFNFSIGLMITMKIQICKFGAINHPPEARIYSYKSRAGEFLLKTLVIPAKAGNQKTISNWYWIPACAGMP